MNFEKIWEKISPLSIMPSQKAKRIYEELLLTKDLKGEMAEIGVFKGSTSLLMKLTFPERKMHCYDTFCGIIGATKEEDKHKDGEFACSLTEVKKAVGIDENTSYHVGFFPDSFNEKECKFVFIHSDTDTYIGTKSTLEVMFPLLVSGGIIIFDDYEWVNCPGVKKAIEEWLNTNVNVCITRKYYTQFVVQKL